MVLLHYLVVPGIGDNDIPRSQATAVRAGEANPPDRDDVVTAPAASAATATAETPQAA